MVAVGSLERDGLQGWWRLQRNGDGVEVKVEKGGMEELGSARLSL